MITSFNTPVRELDGHIFVAVEELYKRDETIEDLKNQLRQEKDAYNRMYNMYDEEKKRNEKAIEYIENYNIGMPYTDFVKKKSLLEILKGEDKE